MEAERLHNNKSIPEKKKSPNVSQYVMSSYTKNLNKTNRMVLAQKCQGN